MGLFSICKACQENFIANRPKQKYCSECEKKGVIQESDSPKPRKKGNHTGGYNKQPCWNCKNFSGGCSWSECFKPVKGWRARKVCFDGKKESYQIEYCPKFESDIKCEKCIEYRKKRCVGKGFENGGAEECVDFKE